MTVWIILEDTGPVFEPSRDVIRVFDNAQAAYQWVGSRKNADEYCIEEWEISHNA